MAHRKIDMKTDKNSTFQALDILLNVPSKGIQKINKFEACSFTKFQAVQTNK